MDELGPGTYPKQNWRLCDRTEGVGNLGLVGQVVKPQGAPLGLGIAMAAPRVGHLDEEGLHLQIPGEQLVEELKGQEVAFLEDRLVELGRQEEEEEEEQFQDRA